MSKIRHFKRTHLDCSNNLVYINSDLMYLNNYLSSKIHPIPTVWIGQKRKIQKWKAKSNVLFVSIISIRPSAWLGSIPGFLDFKHKFLLIWNWKTGGIFKCQGKHVKDKFFTWWHMFVYFEMPKIATLTVSLSFLFEFSSRSLFWNARFLFVRLFWNSQFSIHSARKILNLL